jgi:hypothetical protein
MACIQLSIFVLLKLSKTIDPLDLPAIFSSNVSSRPFQASASRVAKVLYLSATAGTVIILFLYNCCL